MVGFTALPILDKNDSFCLYFNPGARRDQRSIYGDAGKRGRSGR